jgi:hypothetical protein
MRPNLPSDGGAACRFGHRNVTATEAANGPLKRNQKAVSLDQKGFEFRTGIIFVCVQEAGRQRLWRPAASFGWRSWLML